MRKRWHESLVVGHAKIDEDHRRIFDLADRLERAVACGRGHDVIGAIFCDLADYVVKHFSLEERLMERCAFPGAAEHRREHDAFLRHLGDLVERHEVTRDGIVDEACAFLNDWVATHVMGSDHALADYVASHAAEVEPKENTASIRIADPV